MAVPWSLSEWFGNFYAHTRWPGRPRPLEGVCKAGELMFVPSGWWHSVVNLDLTVAITHNFFSRHNLHFVRNFLRTKPDQISGFSSAVFGRDKRHLHATFDRLLGHQVEPESANKPQKRKREWDDAQRGGGADAAAGQPFAFEFQL